MDEKTRDAMIEHATQMADRDFQRQYEFTRAREILQISVREMADMVGESEDWVRNVETGDPTLSDIRRYCLALAFPEAV